MSTLFSDAEIVQFPVEPATPAAVKFTVYGRPVPQGSTRSFIPKGWTRAVITTDNKKLKPWRQQLSETAEALAVPIFAKDRPVSISMDFYFERPKSASLKSRPGMTVKPDGDKLVRAVFDAMTGTVVTDDAQFVDIHARKFYGIPERVEITIGEL